MASDSIKLSSTVSVSRYRKLEQNDERQALAQFVCERFNERYFHPIKSAPSKDRHGFTIMAGSCLVIETLESFYQGKKDTKGHSKEMFAAFFKRDTPLRETLI